MGMVALRRRIGSAFFVAWGQYGEVSRFAQEEGVSRQWVYREAKQVSDTLEGTHGRAELECLRNENAALRTEVEELKGRLAVGVVVDEEKQAEFAGVGQSCGVTLSQCCTLLEVLIPGKALSRASLGRRTQELGKKAGLLLEVFDAYARSQVRDAAADEIYVRDPVLMVVEQESLCWVSGGRVVSACGGPKNGPAKRWLRPKRLKKLWTNALDKVRNRPGQPSVPVTPGEKRKGPWTGGTPSNGRGNRPRTHYYWLHPRVS